MAGGSRRPVQTVAGTDYRRSRLSGGVGCQGTVTNRSPLGPRRADQRRGAGALTFSRIVPVLWSHGL